MTSLLCSYALEKGSSSSLHFFPILKKQISRIRVRHLVVLEVTIAVANQVRVLYNCSWLVAGVVNLPSRWTSIFGYNDISSNAFFKKKKHKLFISEIIT